MLQYVGWPFSFLADLPPLATAQLRLKESYALLQDEKKHSIHHHWTGQEELAAAYEANDNQPAAMHLLRLRRIEKQRRDFQLMRSASGSRLSHRGLSMVVAPAHPDGSGEWRECSSKPYIESACLQENDCRFHQAQSN